jgi:hypothetical protein
MSPHSFSSTCAALVLLAASVGGIAGCECDLSSPDLPAASVSMSDEATGLFTPVSGHPYRTFVGEDGTFQRDMAFEDRLRLVDVHATDTGWEATDVRTFEFAHRYPFGFGSFARETARCTGSARFADGAWTLDFVDTSCAPRNGVYQREEVVRAEQARVRCERYRDCACPMAAGPHGGLFAPYCEAAERMIKLGNGGTYFIEPQVAPERLPYSVRARRIDGVE